MKTEDLVNKMSHFLNNYNCDTDEFVRAMSFEHRTLQQSFTRLCIRWIEHCANLEDHQYDLRNEASHLVSKKLIELFTQAQAYRPSESLPVI